MATLQFQENYYSFRNTERLIGAVAHTQSPDQAALAAIEAKMVEANNDFHKQRYQDAISAYSEAETLIYRHLDPGFVGRPIKFELSRDPGLFDPLLSVALEWLNVLPVREPMALVRPRVPVKPELLGKVVEFDRAGLAGSQVASGPEVNAAADWHLARTYAERGNSKAAEFFRGRAQATDQATVALLDRAAEQTPPAGPELLSGHADITVQRVTDGVVGVRAAPIPALATMDRSLGAIVGGRLANFNWSAGDAPPLDGVRAAIYEKRVSLVALADLINPSIEPSDVALDLPHNYYYVIPLGLAECYHALGDYATAEGHYFQAASYQFLNTAIEAPYLWQRLAILYLDWGNSLFRNDEAADALPIYVRVLMPDGTVPSSALYTTAALQTGVAAARKVIDFLAPLIANKISIDSLGVNPVVAAVIVEVHQHLLKLQGGLDFWGMRANSVPIWTFDYLQGAAINFTQLAISAERDFINFRERADQASLTRQQLAHTATQAAAEVDAANAQAAAATAEATAYSDGVALAKKRAEDAKANAEAYDRTSKQAIVSQAVSTQLSGGDNGDSRLLDEYANNIMAGRGTSYVNPFTGETVQLPYLVGGRGTLAGARQLVASRLNQKYEVAALGRQADEMAIAQTQAEDEAKAANARATAVNAAVTVAELHAAAAQDDLHAFDGQFFTPDVWYRMADVMWRLYQRYLAMAIRTARMMQQAYNFETDQSLHLIKSDYSTDEVNGLLGADALMADIQSFTYELITSTRSKPQPMRQTISLAENYGFIFESQFRKTGVMEFETRIDDFDCYYPGTYAGRIEAVEVEVVGIVPVTGISGTLTNSGISAYRMPASTLAGPNASGLKFRIQPKETLVLSDYAARQDALLVQNDQRIMRIFEGAGLAATWRLDLPKAVNDIDYGALTDVRVTFYYKARFDPDLRDLVLQQLHSRPGVNERQRGIPLRWVYPDAFFHFQDTGELSITLRASDFRSNETKPVLTDVGILVVADGSVSPNGLKVSLGTPGHAAVTAQTDTTGAITSSVAGSPWAPVASGTALGAYTLSIKAADNPVLVKNGKLTLTPIVNIALILGYAFTPKA